MFEMDEEYLESDIPTVLIRSKADCPVQEVRFCGRVAGTLIGCDCLCVVNYLDNE